MPNSISRDVTRLLDPLTTEAQRIDDAFANVLDAVQRMKAAQTDYNQTTRAGLSGHLLALPVCGDIVFQKGSDIGQIVVARLSLLLGTGAVDVPQVAVNLKNKSSSLEIPLANIAKKDIARAQVLVNGIVTTTEIPSNGVRLASDGPTPPRAA